jgi:succinate dehydrogenase / fumarate reductase iron-sulfur subunit
VSEVTFKVFRYDPAKDGGKYYQTYKVPLRRGMTVLQGLLYIKERLDPTLAIRFSCRMATCGSCGMMINGLPRLACYTLIEDLKKHTVVVEPLRNYPVIRDLVADFSEFFEKHRWVKPYLIRIDTYTQEKSNTSYLQSDEELERYIQFAYCIKCGLCYAACPVVASDKEFLGHSPRPALPLPSRLTRRRNGGKTQIRGGRTQTPQMPLRSLLQQSMSKRC